MWARKPYRKLREWFNLRSTALLHQLSRSRCSASMTSVSFSGESCPTQERVTTPLAFTRSKVLSTAEDFQAVKELVKLWALVSDPGRNIRPRDGRKARIHP